MPLLSGSDSDLSLSLSPDPSQSDPVKRVRDGGGYPLGFVDFWDAYPVKVGKADAARAWAKKRPPLAKCLQTIAWQKKSRKWLDGFITNPATWINRGSWDDEPPQSLGPRMSDREARSAAALAAFASGKGTNGRG